MLIIWLRVNSKPVTILVIVALVLLPHLIFFSPVLVSQYLLFLV